MYAAKGSQRIAYEEPLVSNLGSSTMNDDLPMMAPPFAQALIFRGHGRRGPWRIAAAENLLIFDLQVLSLSIVAARSSSCALASLAASLTEFPAV